MAVNEFKKYLSQFGGNPPAALQAIRSYELKQGIQFAKEYVDFLLVCNGGEGVIGKSYLVVYPVEELEKFNDGNEVKTYATGAMFFASNGAGEAYAFDTRSEAMAIHMIPFIGSGWADSALWQPTSWVSSTTCITDESGSDEPD